MAWSADGDAAHELQQPTLSALRARMGRAAYERYEVEKGRWVPLKDVLSATAVLPSAGGGGSGPSAAK